MHVTAYKMRENTGNPNVIAGVCPEISTIRPISLCDDPVLTIMEFHSQPISSKHECQGRPDHSKHICIWETNMICNGSKGHGLANFETLDVFLWIREGSIVRCRSRPKHKDDSLSLRFNVLRRHPKDVYT
jgi:hypothetical protein